MPPHRYDDLGRRILKRTDGADNYTRNYDSTLRRAVWDGSQLLHETRYPTDSLHAAFDSEPETGDATPAQHNCPCIFPPRSVRRPTSATKPRTRSTGTSTAR